MKKVFSIILLAATLLGLLGAAAGENRHQSKKRRPERWKSASSILILR